MLDMSLEQTRFYQDVKAEGLEQGLERGRQEREIEMLRVTVPMLLELGMSIEQIAQRMNIDLEDVRLAAQQSA